jgi:hypothetical protein
MTLDRDPDVYEQVTADLEAMPEVVGAKSLADSRPPDDCGCEFVIKGEYAGVPPSILTYLADQGLCITSVKPQSLEYPTVWVK